MTTHADAGIPYRRFATDRNSERLRCRSNIAFHSGFARANTFPPPSSCTLQRRGFAEPSSARIPLDPVAEGSVSFRPEGGALG